VINHSVPNMKHCLRPDLQQNGRDVTTASPVIYMEKNTMKL